MIKLIKKFFVNIMRDYLLEKHRFKPSALIKKEGANTLFEVDSNYYDTNMDAVTVVRAYPMGTQLLGVSKHDVLEFEEFKNMPKESMAYTAHDNKAFANNKKNSG